MQRLKIPLFSLLLLFIGLCVKSQTAGGMLRGVVTDENNEPFPGAIIQLLNQKDKAVVSDIEGKYLLSLDSGRHVLQCSYLSYQTFTFAVNIEDNLIIEKNIQLKKDEKTLETVVVSSGKYDQKLDELTISMEVLKPNIINNKNTTSVETVLQQVPGVNIIDNDPQIRGGSGFTFGVGSRVAIVVDGIPLLSGDAGRPEWSYIPIENIEQIEVVKGASSVLYGSSAINGVINIRTAYPRLKPKTIINYSAGQYSLPQAPGENWYNASLPYLTNLNFLHSRIIKNNFDFVIGGNFNSEQGYTGPPPPAPYIPSDVKKALLITDTILTFTNQDMIKTRGRMNFNLRYRFKKIPGLSTGINGNAMLAKTNMVLAWFNDSTGLYRGYPGAVFLQNQTLFNIDPFLKYSNGKGLSHSLVTRVFRSDNQISNNLSNNGTMYYGEYQLQREFKQIGFTVTGGLVGNYSQSYANLYAVSGSPNNHVVNTSVFLQMDKKYFNLINLSGGVRYEYFKMNALSSVVAPIYRFGASVQVLKGTHIRTSYGQGFRYPTITERYITTKAGLFGVFPNPDLKPETSQSFEIGLKQGFKFWNVGGYLDVATFHQTYQNTIEYLFGVWDPEISLIGFKFLNTGDSRVRGIDASLTMGNVDEKKKIGVTALVGYTYIEPVSLTPGYVFAHDKSLGGTGQDLSFRSSSMDTTGDVLKYRFKHMFKADAEFKIYNFYIGGSYRYYSRIQNIDKAFGDIELLTSSAAPFLYPIKAVDFWKNHRKFEVIDVRLGCHISKNHKVSVVVNNLLNSIYILRPMKVEAPRTTQVQYVVNF